MSVQATSWVIDKSVHSGSAFVLMFMIANHAHADGTGSYASVQTLAKECRITVRQVQRLLPVLESSGELIVFWSRGRKPHEYAIVMGERNHDILSRLRSAYQERLQTSNPDILSSLNHDILSPLTPTFATANHDISDTPTPTSVTQKEGAHNISLNVLEKSIRKEKSPSKKLNQREEKAWKSILSYLRSNLTPEIFKTWFEQLEFEGIDDGEFVVRANEITKDWISMYYEQMFETVFDRLGCPGARIRWVVEEVANV